MSLFNILQFTAGISLAFANPDRAHQPVTAEENKAIPEGSEDRAHQPYETPDQVPKEPKTDATQPTEPAPREDIVPENQREAPEGLY